MEKNNLYPIALAEDKTDEEILKFFLNAKLPHTVVGDLYAYLGAVEENCPIAVRSSSLLEDAHYQPLLVYLYIYSAQISKEVVLLH